MSTNDNKENKTVLYRYNRYFKSWVFADPERAKEIDAVHRVYEQKITWKELKEAVSEKRYKTIVESYLDWNNIPESNPDPDEYVEWESALPHDRYKMIMYPVENLIWETHDIIPEEICEEYGEKKVTMHDGTYYQIPINKFKQVKNALEKAGFIVKSGEHLIFDEYIPEYRENATWV